MANVASGVPRVAAGAAALVGADETSQRIEDWTNNTFGSATARWDTDPRAAAEQLFGGSLVGAPARAVTWAGQALPYLSRLAAAAPRTTAALEAMTPITLPLTARNVGLNTAVGGAVGAGFEELNDRYNEGVGDREIDGGAFAAPKAESQQAPQAPQAPAQPAPQPQAAAEQQEVDSGSIAAPRVRPDVNHMARTMLAEAANQGEQGLAAVAHVIATRARLTGMTPDEVVRARNQFEPWNTADGQKRMAGYSGPQLENAVRIAEGVLN